MAWGSMDVTVQLRFGGLGGAQVKPLADLFHGEGRLLAKAGCDREFGGIVFTASGQLLTGPTEPFEFFDDDALSAQH